MSKIERKYCLTSTLYLAGLISDISYHFIYLTELCVCVCFADVLLMRTPCDTYHKELESHNH